MAPTTNPSSSKLTAMFENGSGELFTATRVVALVANEVAASDPPNRAATVPIVALSAPNTPAARAAPAGTRMTECTTSQSESIPGILSAKNSTKSMKPLPANIAGCCNRSNPLGKGIQPITPASPVMKTTAYRRSPLAQPNTAAKASRAGMSRDWTPCPTAVDVPAERVCQI